MVCGLLTAGLVVLCGCFASSCLFVYLLVLVGCTQGGLLPDFFLGVERFTSVATQGFIGRRGGVGQCIGAHARRVASHHMPWQINAVVLAAGQLEVWFGETVVCIGWGAKSVGCHRLPL